MNECQLIERCEKRDVFAAAALQGMLANPATDIDHMFDFENKLYELIDKAFDIAELMVQEKDARYRIDEQILRDR